MAHVPHTSFYVELPTNCGGGYGERSFNGSVGRKDSGRSFVSRCWRLWSHSSMLCRA